MHGRRSASTTTSSIPSLSLVLPHPPLPTRRSSNHTHRISLESNSYSSPRTPRSSGSLSTSFPVPPFFRLDSSVTTRTSTDSWNSRNSSFDDNANINPGDRDDGDDIEWEWMPEQIALLEKSLENIPSHLLTPYYNAVPPSNVLDKLAHNITSSKHDHTLDIDWPHTSRATRMKLLELARDRAYESGELRRRHVYDIPEDEQDLNVDEDVDMDEGVFMCDGDGDAKGGTFGKRKLQRQSSMDFMMQNSNVLGVSLKESSIGRLSARLQRADRIISNPAYSPPLITRRPFSLGDSPTTTTSPSASTSPSTSLSTSVNSNNSYQGEKDYNKQKQRLSASSLTSARTSSGAYSNSGITASAQGPRLRRSTTLIGEMSSIHSGLMNGKSIGGRKKRSSTVTVPCSAPSSSESPLTATTTASSKSIGIGLGAAPITKSIHQQGSRIRRSESFSSHGANMTISSGIRLGLGLGHSLKRAPSFGAGSGRSCVSADSASISAMSVDDVIGGGSVTSADAVEDGEKENVNLNRRIRARHWDGADEKEKNGEGKGGGFVNVVVVERLSPAGKDEDVVVSVDPSESLPASVSDAPSKAVVAGEANNNSTNKTKRTKSGKVDASAGVNIQPEKVQEVYPSSDEEEKMRSKRAKKARLRAGSRSSSTKEGQPLILTTSNSSSSSSSSSSTSTSKFSSTNSDKTKTETPDTTPTPSPTNSLRKKDASTKSKRVHIHTRTSSMFGDELPNPQKDPEVPRGIPANVSGSGAGGEGAIPAKMSRQTTPPPSAIVEKLVERQKGHLDKQARKLEVRGSDRSPSASSGDNLSKVPVTPGTPVNTNTRRSLRRVGTFNFPFGQRPSRKIMFGTEKDSCNDSNPSPTSDSASNSTSSNKDKDKDSHKTRTISRLDKTMGELLDLTPTEERPRMDVFGITGQGAGVLGSAFRLN